MLLMQKPEGKRIGRKGLAPIDRRRIIETYEQAPAQSLRTIAKASRATLTSTAKTLNDYKAGLLDRRFPLIWPL